jgi:hypothetical protein
MKRRHFLRSSLAAAGLTAVPWTVRAAEDATGSGLRREYYELRQYHLRKGPQQRRFDEYAKTAAIPALNRLGIGPIGVFQVGIGPESPTVYVLIPYKSLDQMGAATDRMRSDADYQKLGADYVNATAADPAYVRVESSLLVAFEGMPKLEAPVGAATNQPRWFELRTYESHSKKACKKKIEMFNQGEIALFRRTGLAPVFFGETLIGTRLPNLTYMLVFNSMADRDKNWSTFASDPEWKTLSSKPGYTDAEIVSNIGNLFLRPTAYSQI